MIRHIYFFRLKEGKNPDEVIRHLKTLKEHCPTIKELEIGKDFIHADNSYEICEHITFDTLEEFESFKVHPYHAGMREYMKECQAEGVKMDYIV